MLPADKKESVFYPYYPYSDTYIDMSTGTP